MVARGAASLRPPHQRSRAGRGGPFRPGGAAGATAAVLDGVPLLPVTPEAEHLARLYVERRVMPADLGGDALHLAIASVHACDFLLTWNQQHLANANKFDALERTNRSVGLPLPRIVVPSQLPAPDVF